MTKNKKQDGDEVLKKIQKEFIKEDGSETQLAEQINRTLDIIKMQLFSNSRGSPFIYEIIQNADDANAEKLLIFLSEKSKEIYIVHDGEKKFEEDDVESICSIGKSEKRKNVDKIGFFGIGFKSTFLISDNVEINSGNYHFKFKNDLENNNLDNLWMVYPQPPEKLSGDIQIPNSVESNIEDMNIDSDQSTIFVLRNVKERDYKTCVDSLSKEKKHDWNLTPRVLLFLNKIKKLKIFKESGEQFEEYRSIEKKYPRCEKPNFFENENDDLEIEIVKTEDKQNNNKDISFWLFSRYEFDINKYLEKQEDLSELSNPQKRIDKERKIYKRLEDKFDKQEVNTAFKLDYSDDINKINFDDVSGAVVSAFYSGINSNEIESGLHFYCSADFIFDTSRKSMKTDSLWNQILANNIAILLVKQAEILSKFYHSNKNKNLFPQFLASILCSYEPKYKNYLTKNREFFNKNIIAIFVKKIRANDIFPAYDKNNNLKKVPSKDTVYFWPQEGIIYGSVPRNFSCSSSKESKDKQQFYMKKDVECIFNRKDFVHLKKDEFADCFDSYAEVHKRNIELNNFENSTIEESIKDELGHKPDMFSIDSERKEIEMNVYKWNDIDHIYYLEENEYIKEKETFPSRIKNNYFLDFEFVANYVKKMSSIINKEWPPKNLDRISKTLFRNREDLKALISSEDWLNYKLNSFGETKEDLSNEKRDWLYKFYAYMLEKKIHKVGDKEKLKIFFNERGNEFESYKNIKRYPKKGKKLYENLGLEGLSFLHPGIDGPESWWKFFTEKWKDDYPKKDKRASWMMDRKKYFRGFKKLLDEFQIKGIEPRNIIRNMSNSYQKIDNEKDFMKTFDCKKNEIINKNINHLKLLEDLNKSKSHLISNFKEDNQNKCIIKFLTKDDGFKKPGNVFLSKKVLDNINKSESVDEVHKSEDGDTKNDIISKSQTVLSYYNMGLIDHEIPNYEKDKKNPEVYFIDSGYCNNIKKSRNIFDANLIQFSEKKLDFGSILDDNIGVVGEEIVKKYLEKKSEQEFTIMNMQRFNKNNEYFDLAIINTSYGKEKDIERILSNGGHTLIEVKTSSNENFLVTKGQAKTISNYPGDLKESKKEIFEKNDYFVYTLSNFFEFDKSKFSVFDAEKLDKFFRRIEETKITFNEHEFKKAYVEKKSKGLNEIKESH